MSEQEPISDIDASAALAMIEDPDLLEVFDDTPEGLAANTEAPEVPMTPERMAATVEAILFAAAEPLSIARIAKAFPPGAQPTREEIITAIGRLSATYANSSIELLDLASGYCFRIRAAFAPWVHRLQEQKPPRYSRALLETLVLIAYRQPITRAEIEDVRGVAVSSQLIRTLVERDWIKEVGHKEVPGRPALFSTTKAFLDYFNLKKLTDLPPLQSLLDMDAAEQALRQQPELGLEAHEIEATDGFAVPLNDAIEELSNVESEASSHFLGAPVDFPDLSEVSLDELVELAERMDNFSDTAEPVSVDEQDESSEVEHIERDVVAEEA